MKMRVSTATLRRVAMLEQKVITSHITALWPKIMGIDEWSAIAEPMQQALFQDTRGNEEDGNRYQNNIN